MSHKLAASTTARGADVIDGASSLVLNQLGAVTLVGFTGAATGWFIF